MKILKYTLSKHSAPSVISPDDRNSEASLEDIVSWITSEHLNLVKELHQRGALLLRGFKAIQNAEDFETVVAAFAPEPATDEGSSSPRTQISKRVYTSTDAPAFIPIELHQERSFNKDFPDKIAFFCEIAPEKGGETPIADMRAVYRALPKEIIERFEAKGVRLRRRLPTVNLTRNPAIRTWSETFGTDSEVEVQKIAAQLEWQLQWRQRPLKWNSYVEVDNPVCPPFISHPITGETVWFNQAHVLNNNNFLYWAKQYGGFKLWATALLAPVLKKFFYYHHVYGDGSEIMLSDLNAIRKAVSDQEIQFSWQQGDVLILDNILMAHGRCRFKGKRQILVSMMKNMN